MGRHAPARVGPRLGEGTTARAARIDRATTMMAMTRLKVTDATVVRDFVLRVRFNDGAVEEIDLADELWGPVFEPLRDPAVFRQCRVDQELGAVVWPNGADLDPYVLRYGKDAPK